MFLINCVLMLSWAILTGGYSLENLFLGFVLGYTVLWITSGRTGTSYFRKSWKALVLLFYFLWQLVKANLRVAREVITPKHHMRPGIVAVPLEIDSDLGILLVANMVTLTPGSLTLEISKDKKTLFMHEMYIETKEKVMREIKEGYERRVREVLQK